jgi:hypothetical protein
MQIFSAFLLGLVTENTATNNTDIELLNDAVTQLYPH